jgi:hypothetical protein
MKNKKTAWRLIAKSLGEKSGKDNKEADKIALIRLLITSQILITNFFIIFGVVRHWNDVPSNVPETKEERILSTNSNVP